MAAVWSVEVFVAADLLYHDFQHEASSSPRVSLEAFVFW
jgi:hypothetical protein